MADPADDDEKIVYLVGKDYPQMCEVCRGSIDRALELVLMEVDPGGRAIFDFEDDEAPNMMAYDLGWFCGRHECKVLREAEEVGSDDRIEAA